MEYEKNIEQNFVNYGRSFRNNFLKSALKNNLAKSRTKISEARHFFFIFHSFIIFIFYICESIFGYSKNKC